MIVKSLLSVGAFSLLAQAFLVIPENINLSTELSAGKGRPVVEEVFNTQDVKIDCSACPFALESNRNGRHEWTNNIKSDLEMKVSTDGQALTFNDVPIYPLGQGSPPRTLFVTQKKKDGEQSPMKGYDGNLRISYSVEFNEQKMDDGNNIVSILMTIMGLDGEMIRPDNLEIRAIKTADGKLSLPGRVVAVPASPDALDAKCENILCRVFTKLITGMNKAKSSAKNAGHKMKCLCVKCLHKIMGHKGPHHRGPKGGISVPFRRPDGAMELPSHVVFKPAGHHGHRHHHHGGFFSKMTMVMATAIKVVFVPVLIGVAFGMAASALGMLVGQAIVFLWMRFRRTPETGAYERIETDVKEAPPAYQDIQDVEVIDEKGIEVEA